MSMIMEESDIVDLILNTIKNTAFVAGIDKIDEIKVDLLTKILSHTFVNLDLNNEKFWEELSYRFNLNPYTELKYIRDLVSLKSNKWE